MYKIIVHRNEFRNTRSKKCTYYAHIHWIILSLVVILGGCSLPSSTPAEYSQAFMDVHDAVTKRDGTRLMAAVISEDPLAAEAAWRALASTPSAPTDSVVKLALADGSDLAWFALSTRSLSSDQLRVLESHAFSNGFPSGLIRTLGLQGDDTTALLMDSWSGNIGPGHENEAELALAMSRLAMRRGAQVPLLDRLLSRAAQTTSAEAARGWLYAPYRSGAINLSAEQAEALAGSLDSFITIGDPDVKRTVFRVLAKSKSAAALELYPVGELAQVDTRTAVDILRTLSSYADQTKDVKLQALTAIKALYGHGNPLVVGEALAVTRQMQLEPGELPLAEIDAVAAQAKGSDDRLYLRALSERLSFEPRPESVDSVYLRRLAKDQPYLASDALMVLVYGSPAGEMLAEIKPFADSDVHMHRMAAATILNAFARSLPQVGASQSDIATTRSAIWEMLSTRNRSLVYTLFGALRQTEFREAGDNDKVLAMLKSYRMPEDIEVYQAVLPSLLRDMGEAGRPLADSMATFGNAALNRVVMEYVSPEVRESIEASSAVSLQGPDWALLRKLGNKPTLQLETEAGLIVVEMDPLRAPSTVTGIARLAEAGSYNGVPFHRVVPNFVIQGGDVESGDGFGGPDFVIPNEPSEHGFVRGAAGIASAGKDTEGSQYFFMIDWAPHLDGGYTVFGQVVSGMDVVDRIRVGDRVIRARISNL